MTDFFRFIGKDVSMGFEKGKIYLLTISDWYHKNTTALSIIRSVPTVLDINDYCPYSTCETFFENWERV